MCKHPSGLKELSTQALTNVLERETHKQFYKLGDWPFLLVRCGCPESADLDPLTVGYESLTPDQAREWNQGH